MNFGLTDEQQILANVARRFADERAPISKVRDVMESAAESVFGRLQLFPRAPGVIGAEHKFAKRRLQNLSQWGSCKVFCV